MLVPLSAHPPARSLPDSLITERAGTEGSTNLEHFMRTCVFALALVALAQPAFAKSHSHHAHHAAHHHARHVHHYARMRPTIEAGMVQAFARTNATDRPFFSDPSFPNRSSSQNGWSQNNWNQNAWNQGGWNEASAPAAQPFGFRQAPRVRVARARNTALDAAIARHAAANGVPVELVHRVVKRESGYNPRASHAGNFGLMQIRYATARGVGYTGSAAGLLDPEVNLTYAVKYLAGAYRAAGGNASRAVSLYASGYHGRGVQVARRRAAPADAWSGQGSNGWGWQSAPVSMRTDAWRGML
jgi:soluble lytic murein transglycosylase-like protein